MPATEATAKEGRFTVKRLREFSSKNAISLVLLALIMVIGFINSDFLQVSNIRNILIIASVRVIIALGISGILITGGTDLSAGRTVGLTACIAASLLQRPDYADRMFRNMGPMPLLVPILIAAGVGLLVGIINGSIVAYLKVPPFIATLGTMVIVYGAASLYIDRPPRGAQPIGGLRPDFTNIGTGYLGPNGDLSIPYLILIAAAIIFVYWVMLNKTRLGKNTYAIGGNPKAATVSGVNVEKNLIMVYAIAGCLYGLAGALLAARTGGATNNYGMSYEMDAIAAAVIGGVSTSGGIGKVGGIITGVIILEVLNNGLVILGVNAYWQQVIKGVIIVAAVAFDIRKYLAKK
jgi:methyl-galactoside transport system permease protein